MEIRRFSAVADLENYDHWVRLHPHGSLWQSTAWQQFQEACGREVRIYVVEAEGKIHAAALVVLDRTHAGLCTWELPRGPLWSVGREADAQALLTYVIAQAKREKCLSLTFSPPIPLNVPTVPTTLSHRHVHPETTRILDLTRTPEEILAQMKPKGRYNIGIAERDGVIVELSQDAAAFAALARETGKRDGFTPHGGTYYECFLRHLPGSFLLLAYGPDGTKMQQEAAGKTRETGSASAPIAGLFGVLWEKTGIYYYGASSYGARRRMAPYALQWKAMQHCKAQGCSRYDLFGIAPEGAPDHPWSGVTDFKSKFGGTSMSYPPEQQIILKPLLHHALQLKRKILR